MRGKALLLLYVVVTKIYAYPVIIGEDNVNVDDRPSLVRCQDVPFAVRGAVRDRSVVLALFTTNQCIKSRAIRRDKAWAGKRKHGGSYEGHRHASV